MIQIKCKIGLNDLISVRNPAFALKNRIPRFDPNRDLISHWITFENWAQEITKSAVLIRAERLIESNGVITSHVKPGMKSSGL